MKPHVTEVGTNGTEEKQVTDTQLARVVRRSQLVGKRDTIPTLARNARSFCAVLSAGTSGRTSSAATKTYQDSPNFHTRQRMRNDANAHGAVACSCSSRNNNHKCWTWRAPVNLQPNTLLRRGQHSKNKTEESRRRAEAASRRLWAHPTLLTLEDNRTSPQQGGRQMASAVADIQGCDHEEANCSGGNEAMDPVG